MNQQLTNGNQSLEPTIGALSQLSPNSQRAVIALVRQLAEGEGVNVALASTPGLQSPIEGIPLWLAEYQGIINR